MKLSHIVKMLAVAALVVCLFSIGNLLVIRSRYRTAEKLYEDAAESYTQPAVETPTGSDEDAYAEQPVQRREDCAPIVVDFAALQEINSDVFAWIYCEDSVINYPVVHSFDNDYYLEHAFNKEDSPSGAIFSDYRNSFGVQDANTILYGHHMQNGTMFMTLKYWYDQDYYDAHPVMWLLTPEQDYKLELYSVHSTSAVSSIYNMYYEPTEKFIRYIEQAKEESGFVSDVIPDPQLHHVVLSTCAYSFINERTVLHGQLLPMNSAAGIPFDGSAPQGELQDIPS